MISYPCGGFGHFIYYVLSEFTNDVVRIDNSNFKFDAVGTSHAIQKATSIYQHDPETYDATIKVDPGDKSILVLVDNGINNDSYDKVTKTFPNARIVRMVIDEKARPLVYMLMSLKAQRTDHINETELQQVQQNWSDSDQDWAKRENFTLFYHNWPFSWLDDTNCINVNISDMISGPEQTIKQLITRLGFELADEERLKIVLDDWLRANSSYFRYYNYFNEIEKALKCNQDISLEMIDDLHAQGYINYLIEKMFDISIKVNDHQDWFKSTGEILKMIKDEEKIISNRKIL